jgi:hypothetical protein
MGEKKKSSLFREKHFLVYKCLAASFQEVFNNHFLNFKIHVINNEQFGITGKKESPTTYLQKDIL